MPEIIPVPQATKDNPTDVNSVLQHIRIQSCKVCGTSDSFTLHQRLGISDCRQNRWQFRLSCSDADGRFHAKTSWRNSVSEAIIEWNENTLNTKEHFHACRCGSSIITITRNAHSDGKFFYYARCASCSFSTPGGSTAVSAIENWNITALEYKSAS